METARARHIPRVTSLLLCGTLLAGLLACSDDTSAKAPGSPIGSTATDANTDAKVGAVQDAKSGLTNDSSTAADSGSVADSGGSSGVVDSGSGGGGTRVTPCSTAGYVCRMGDFVDPCAAAGGFAMSLYSCGAGYPGSCCTK